MTLIDADSDPAVSIYLPVHQIPPEDKVNGIRFRNLIRDAEKDLERNGFDPSEILAYAERDEIFRLPIGSPGMRGIAIFISAAFTRTHPLPIAPPEHIAVKDSFHILPLMPLIDSAQSFFIIAIDQKDVCLFRATRYEISVIETEVMEDSMAKIRGITQLPADVGFHSASSAGGGRPDAKHHAQGESPADYQQVQLDEFTHGVANAVDRILAEETATLVAVCEPNLLGMFRRHCQYPKLASDSIAKSPVGLDESEIHEACVEIVEPELNRPKLETIDRFNAGFQRGDATVSVQQGEILKSATEGRVGNLLLTEDWRNSGLEEIDRIAHETLKHGGDVIVVPAEEMPGETAVGAIYRY
ncbi:MAG: hypothetical protein WD767_14280 [Alphaproteobacteria bacterium]